MDSASAPVGCTAPRPPTVAAAATPAGRAPYAAPPPAAHSARQARWYRHTRRIGIHATNSLRLVSHPALPAVVHHPGAKDRDSSDRSDSATRRTRVHARATIGGHATHRRGLRRVHIRRTRRCCGSAGCCLCVQRGNRQPSPTSTSCTAAQCRLNSELRALHCTHHSSSEPHGDAARAHGAMHPMREHARHRPPALATHTPRVRAAAAAAAAAGDVPRGIIGSPPRCRPARAQGDRQARGGRPGGTGGRVSADTG